MSTPQSLAVQSPGAGGSALPSHEVAGPGLLVSRARAHGGHMGGSELPPEASAVGSGAAAGIWQEGHLPRPACLGPRPAVCVLNLKVLSHVIGGNNYFYLFF